MWDQICRAGDVKGGPAPFPEMKGKPSLQVLNADTTLGRALCVS